MSKSLKIVSFDIARAIGMLYIIAAWHVANYTSILSLEPYGKYVTYGVLGMFMFVSGWLLDAKYAVSEKVNIKHFAKKRVLRLMPLYLIALVAFYFSGGINIKTLILALFGLSSFIPPQPPTLWFVSLIIDFYLLFPFLSYRKHYFSYLVFGIVYLSIYILCIVSPNIDKRFLLYFPCFYAGILFDRYRLMQYLLKWQVFIGSIGLISVCIWLDYVISTRIVRLVNTTIIALAFTNILIYLSELMTKLPITKIFTWLAYSSMAAYMFHRQIIGAFRRFLIWPEDGIVRLLFLLLICVPVILIGGYLIQLGYDYIIKRLEKKRSDN